MSINLGGDSNMQLKKLQGFAKRTLAVVLTVVMIFGSGINVLADETPVLPPSYNFV